MIAITRRFKFRTIIALILISLAVNLYFYFFNQQYLPYILFFAIFFMILATVISYLNARIYKAWNSLGRVWMLFAIGLAIWTFTNSVSTTYTFVTKQVFPYFLGLVVVDIIGYIVFAYANVQLAKFTDLIKIGKPKVPFMKFALIITLGTLIFLGIALGYLNVRYGQSEYLFTIYLLADALIAGSMLFPLLSLKNLSIQRPLTIFIFGFIVLILAESTYFFFVISGIYKYLFVGSPQHFLYMLAFGIFALAAYDQKRQLS